MSNGKRAVTLAVIKQADENMEDMKLAINSTMDYFKKVYPDIDFSISRNQTELLDYTISIFSKICRWVSCSSALWRYSSWVTSNHRSSSG